MKKAIFILIILVSISIELFPNSNKSSPFSQAKFVPNISLILDLSYNYRTISDNDYLLINLPGTDNTYGTITKGFNFNYLELAFETVVDPYFDFFTALHIACGEIHVEEAYVKTRSLPAGFKIKAGKFFSGFGRLNSQHDHIWNFSDRPLVYSSILGSENLNEIGLQFTWVAPVDFYLVFGGEILQGENKTIFGNEDFFIFNNEFNKNDSPLVIGFVKTSFDIDDFIVLVGASIGSGRHQAYSQDINYAFSGDSILYGFDMTLKYMFDSYRYISLQSEYIGSNSKGDEYLISTGDKMPFDGNISGLYSELIWRYNLRWRTGFRYDFIGKRPERIYEKENLNRTGVKYSAMIEFNPSEFSRIRLQFIHDQAKFLFGEQKTFNEIFLNINVSVGAHGAHKF